MGEEPVGSDVPKGILKNKSEKKVPVSEPIIHPEKAHVLCPTTTMDTRSFCSGSGLSGGDSTTREFLLHKRSSLTHTPDIARVFGQNATKYPSGGSESLHEFQKIKLRHVDAHAGESSLLSAAQETTKKDIVVNMTVGKIDLMPGSPRKTSSPTRKSSHEGYRPFGERSSSFSQMSSPKSDSLMRDDPMSSSMIATSSGDLESPLLNKRKPLITRGELNGSSMKKFSEEKRVSSIFRESQAKNTSSPTNGIVSPSNSDHCTKTVEAKKHSTSTAAPLKRNDSKVKEAPSSSESHNSKGTSEKSKSPSRSVYKSVPSNRNPIKNSTSKENKMPAKGIKRDSKNDSKEDKKPTVNGSTVSKARMAPSAIKKSPPHPKPLGSTKTGSGDPMAKKTGASPSSAPKKTPEIRRRVIQKPSTVDREAMKSKSRQSPSLRRKTAPTPIVEAKKKSPSNTKAESASLESEESKKQRPERVSGVFRPTQSWLYYMGDKAGGSIKSRSPSPGLSTGAEPRKRSCGERKTSGPSTVRRTESFNRKKSYGETSLQRSSSLRSNSSGKESEITCRKVSSSRKVSNAPPPTLPKPGKAASQSLEAPDSGIEETSFKASSVIQKFEAVKDAGKTPMLGFPESNASDKQLLGGLDEPSRPSLHSSKAEKSSFLPNPVLSPIMVTNEEYTTQKMQSHSRSGSVASGDYALNNSGGYQAGEKYKTTMVVRLHPGQTRKLSNCSSSTTTSGSPSFNTGSMPRHDSASFLSTRKEDSECISTSGTTSTTNSSRQTRYSADIHGSQCSASESNSCCASGLEITFESPPQTIDIKLIPSPSVEERKTNMENEEEGKNYISQEMTNKTRQ